MAPLPRLDLLSRTTSPIQHHILFPLEQQSFADKKRAAVCNKSFDYYGPNLYNALPILIKCNKGNSFKISIKERFSKFD